MNYLILLSLTVILFGSRFHYIKKKNLKFNIQEIFIFIFLSYVVIFVKITLLQDQEFTLNLGSMIKQAYFTPPLTHTIRYAQFKKTIFTTIPFGFFISAILSTNLNYKKLFQFGFLISFIVETMKLFKLNEIWSINHILLMMTGFFIGFFIYQIFYKFLRIINKEVWLDLLKISHPQSFVINWKLILSLIATYIIGIYMVLIYQTHPLSILEKSKVIYIDNFQVSLDENFNYLKINGYYKTDFNRLNHLFSTKIDLNDEPIYNVYTLMEPYKPKTDTSYGILVVGWINEPLSIKISYKDYIYTKQLDIGLFTVVYPKVVDSRPVLDIYADSSPEQNLNITFYDEFDNIVDVPFKKEIIE